MEVVVELIGNDLSAIASYDYMFKEKEYGELRVFLDRPLDQEEMDMVVSRLPDLMVGQDAGILLMTFKYTDGLLLAVASVLTEEIPSSIVLGWQLGKEDWRTIPWGWLFLGAGVVVAMVESRKKKWK